MQCYLVVIVTIAKVELLLHIFADFIDFIMKVQKRDNEKDRARGGKRCLGSGWGSF